MLNPPEMERSLGFLSANGKSKKLTPGGAMLGDTVLPAGLA